LLCAPFFCIASGAGEIDFDSLIGPWTAIPSACTIESRQAPTLVPFDERRTFFMHFDEGAKLG
jgi:hypothetical protein